MKTILAILTLVTSYAFTQPNLVNLNENIDNKNIFTCESDIYIDTTGFGDEFLNDYRLIFEERYINNFYSKGPFGYNEGFDKKLKMFDTNSLEVGTNDIKSEFNEIKNKLEDLEVKYGKILFKRTINTMNQDESVQLYFENNVNCVDTETELKEIFSPINCSFDCYPAELFASVDSEINEILSFENSIIYFKKPIQNIRLIDLLGNYQDIEYKSEINLSNLQIGVYILQFTFEEEIYVFKFIKE